MPVVRSEILTWYVDKAVQTYLFIEFADTSMSHCERVKSILSGFAELLNMQEEKKPRFLLL